MFAVLKVTRRLCQVDLESKRRNMSCGPFASITLVSYRMCSTGMSLAEAGAKASSTAPASTIERYTERIALVSCEGM